MCVYCHVHRALRSNMFLAAVICITLFAVCSSQPAPIGVQILDKILLAVSYDKRISPDQANQDPANAGATFVKTSLTIQDIYAISDADFQFAMEVFLRRSWTDSRLVFKNFNASQIIARSSDAQRIWVPDIYFVNERRAKLHDITSLNEAAWISNDGTVIYTSRYTTFVSCNMDLHSFPLDTQSCQMKLEIYSYTTDSVRMSWAEATPIQLPNNFNLQSFQMKGYVTEACETTYTTSGPYSCVTITFKFQRIYTYHVVTTYIPSACVVCISWVAFYVAPDSVPGRVMISTITVLTIVTQIFIGNLALPKVPYVKAIDIWLAGCLFFVFAALVEYAIVNVLLRAHVDKRLLELAQTAEGNENTSTSSGVITRITEYLAELTVRSAFSTADQIDFFSRFFFPFAFAIFTTAYWATYLTAK